MTFRIVLVVLLTATLAAARPTTRRSLEARKQPTTQPGKPATRPAEAAVSPKEIIAQFKERQKKEQEALKVALIDLDQPVVEGPARFALLADTRLTLQSILERINAARDDGNVRAVLLNLGPTEFNLAQAQELRDALLALRKVGKRAFVFSDTYDTAGYIAATGASDICMLAGGEIMIPGVGMETMFAKGLLDKVGVRADYVQIGQYKGADEQFTRTEPSKEMRGELNKILDSLYEQIVDGISYRRNLTKNDVQDMINGVMMNGKVAKSRRFVDHLVDQDGLRDLIQKELGREVRILHDYGQPEKKALDWSNPLSLLSAMGKKEHGEDKPQIALIYAEGVIVDGEGDEGLFSEGTVGSDELRKSLRVASRDANVKAIVLRIDSPGGSAMASEVIWQAARRAAKTKPLIVSVGGMAASGGYYIACAGETIYADPSAIVGSIGVVGGKFVLKDLLEKVGVRTETFARGTNADLFSSNQPFTEVQRRLVTNWMQQTYEQFVDRILTTRKGRIKDIDDVAHGRIFLAKQARELGMVDELGGLGQAIAAAAGRVKLKEGAYELRIVPATRTLIDVLRGVEPEVSLPIRPQVNIGSEGLLRALTPGNGKLLRQQIQMLHLLQQRPVVLVSPYAVTVK